MKSYEKKMPEIFKENRTLRDGSIKSLIRVSFTLSKKHDKHNKCNDYNYPFKTSTTFLVSALFMFFIFCLTSFGAEFATQKTISVIKTTATPSTFTHCYNLFIIYIFFQQEFSEKFPLKLRE